MSGSAAVSDVDAGERSVHPVLPSEQPASAANSVESSASAPMEPPMVRVRGLGKRFRIYARPGDRLWDWLGLRGIVRSATPTDFWAVRGVGFDVQRGECLGILGVNGSGKSTLLKMLTGALHPTEGTLEVRGRVLSLIELGTGLNPLLTGRENISNAATLLGFPRDFAKQRMAEIEAFAELGEFFDRQVNVYSSGMKVRLAFSMFACFDPELFIVDEALSVGDVFFQQKCVARLKQMLSGGMTMIFVSHDQGAVLNLCTRAIVMSQGVSTFEGRPEEAVARYISALRGGTRFVAAGSTPATIGGRAAETATELDADLEQLILSHDVLGPRRSTRHGTGDAQILGVRVVDRAGHDSLHAPVGSTLRFQLLIEAKSAIAAPRCGVRLYDRFGTLVFAGGTPGAGVSIPALAPGSRVAVELELTLDVQPGEYTFGVGCGEPDPERAGAGIHHDQIELLGPIGVSQPLDVVPVFHGVARLPLRAKVLSAGRPHGGGA